MGQGASSPNTNCVISVDALEAPPLPLALWADSVTASPYPTLLKTPPHSSMLAATSTGKRSVRNAITNDVMFTAQPKSHPKRTITHLRDELGHGLLHLEGVHECVATDFTRGEQPSPNSTHPTPTVLFTVRALNYGFYDWEVTMRNALASDDVRHVDDRRGASGDDVNNNDVDSGSGSGIGSIHLSSLLVSENAALGVLDVYEGTSGRVIARIAKESGAKMLWQDELYATGRSIAIAIAPHVDAILISALALLVETRINDDQAGLGTRPGNLANLRWMLDAVDDGVDEALLSRTTSSRSGGGISFKHGKRLGGVKAGASGK